MDAYAHNTMSTHFTQIVAEPPPSHLVSTMYTSFTQYHYSHSHYSHSNTLEQMFAIRQMLI